MQDWLLQPGVLVDLLVPTARVDRVRVKAITITKFQP